MSIAELKAEVDRLTPEEREELRDYLRGKIRPLDPETRRKLTEKINDNNPAHWLTLEELQKRLGDSQD
jgi:AraC-like DNA-binding protein